MIDTPNHGENFNKINNSISQKTFTKRNLFSVIFRWVVYLVLLSLGGSLSYTWYFLTQKLSPVVEKELTNYFNRPVKLGKVEGIFLSGVRFGKTEIPATNTDTDFASINAIDININPFQLLAHKKLELKINLIQPNIYIEQDNINIWIKTKLKNSIPEWHGIAINLQSIDFDNTNLTLKPESQTTNIKTEVKVKLNNGNVFFDNKNISFATKGKLIDGGNFNLNGFYKYPRNQLNLLFNSKAIPATEINNLFPLPLQLTFGKINSNLQLNLNNNKLEKFTGDAILNEVTLKLPNLSKPLQKTDGKISFHNSYLQLDNIQTNLGLIHTQLNGLIKTNGNINLQATTQPIDIKKAITSINLPLPSVVMEGKIKANISLTGNVNNPQLTTQIHTINKTKVDKIEFNSMQANLQLFKSDLTIKELTFIPTLGGKIISNGKFNLDDNNPQFSLDFKANNILGKKVTDIYAINLPLKLGKVSGNYNLSGTWKNLKLSQLTATTQVEVAEGIATISNLKHNQKNWQANLDFTKINLAKLPNNPCIKLNCHNSQLNGNLLISGNLKTITKNNINVTGNANFNLAGGIVNLKNLQLNQGNWQTLVKTNDLELTNFVDKSFPQLTGKIKANLNVSGNVNNQQKIIALGEGEVKLPQGKIDIQKLKLQGNNFTTQLATKSLELNSFSSELRGKAKGKLNVSGDINHITAETVKIFGNIDFNEGLGFIKQPLTTAFNWDGKKLQIDKVNSKEIQAKGIVNLNTQTKKIEDFNLDVLTENLDLKSPPLNASSQLKLVNYQGKVNFNGKIFGTLKQPNILGDMALNNFALTAFKFNNLLGKIEIEAKKGVKINLSDNTEKGDNINLSLDSNYQLTELDIQVNQAKLNGLKNNQIFSLNASNIPVNKLTKSFLDFLPISEDKVGGEISGKLDINLDNFDFIAPEISIKNPAFANFKGDIITTNLEYSQGNLKINNGKITKKNSNYLFNAEVKSLQENPEFQGKIAVENGNIQHFLESLEIFQWEDFKRGMNPPKYGKAEDLYTPNQNNLTSSSPQPLASVGLQDSTLLQQLDYFQKIHELFIKNKKEKLASSIPELEELKGIFNSNVSITGSFKEGIKAEFDLEGKNWQWGHYQANLVKAKGSYKDGFLTILPISIQQDKSLFSLSGSFNKERLSGQIKLVNLPVNEIQKVIALPDIIGLGGMINANIAISGSEKNPLAKGEVSINDATLNNTKIESNQASFNYKNSRLNFFANSILANKSEPLTIKGSFPYQLFSNSIPPDNNDFDISLNVNDQVFPLLDILTNKEINWRKGKGNINLDISGNYYQQKNLFTNINTQGIATVEDAIISAKILPDKPLTEVNGKILFTLDEIQVENFTGKFSGGDINIIGNLPIINTNTPNINPLMINFHNLTVNLPELYQGNLKGNLQITGSAIAPKLAGDLELVEGQIFLSDNKVENGTINTSINDNNNTNFANMQLKELNLILGSNIKIIKEPILSVIAKGNLKLKGSLNNLKPEGNIYLTQGKVNLFTSQLKLAENHENIAKFTIENGLDPYLDIELLASVTETNRHQFVSSPVASEIKDLSNSEVPTIQTIRVKANVKGLSSQLADKLELTSSPQRSKPEIIALLGGGFFDNFNNQRDSSLGLANLASSAFLGSFQGQLGEALGLSEFRLFPTQIIDADKRNSSLGLGAEIGLDIGNNFSISVIKILTNEQAPQYSVRYRINDKTLLRGSSDFSNDNRGSIEFENRF